MYCCININDCFSNRYALVDVHVSSPIVPFRESIVHPPKVDMVNQTIHDLNQRIRSVKPGLESDVEVVKPGLVEMTTSNRQCRIRLRAVPLPASVTGLLVESAALMKTLELYSAAAHGNGDSSDGQKRFEINASSLTALRTLREKIADAFDSAGKKWKGSVSQVWSCGPHRCGSNVLLNRIPGYSRPSIWWRLDGDDAAELCSIRNFDSSVVNGFQLATVSGPICEEPMQGVCFIMEKWEYVNGSVVEENKTHHEENKKHHEENKTHHEENKTHHEENKKHHEENKTHHEENKTHHEVTNMSNISTDGELAVTETRKLRGTADSLSERPAMEGTEKGALVMTTMSCESYQSETLKPPVSSKSSQSELMLQASVSYESNKTDICQTPLSSEDKQSKTLQQSESSEGKQSKTLQQSEDKQSKSSDTGQTVASNEIDQSEPLEDTESSQSHQSESLRKIQTRVSSEDYQSDAAQTLVTQETNRSESPDVVNDVTQQRQVAFGPFSGQLMSCVKDGCRKAFQTQPQRLVVAMYKCNIQATAEVLGRCGF